MIKKLETMDVTVRRVDDRYRFEGKGDRIGKIIMDNGVNSGGKGEAPSPLQAFLMTVGGCAGIDIVSILEKSRQRIDDLEIELHADREKRGFISPFEHINLHFKLSGDMDDAKAERAVRLSLEKYCTVSHMMQKAMRMTASISVNGGETRQVPLELT